MVFSNSAEKLKISLGLIQNIDDGSDHLLGLQLLSVASLLQVKHLLALILLLESLTFLITISPKLF